MELIECYIENFGTLHHCRKEFHPGLNCINEENGWGKTTFAVFIRAMFYGMDKGRSKDLNQQERKKYAPWQAGRFGGSVTFQTKNRKFRLERFFGGKEKEDCFLLIDLATGLESREYSEQIGEELFGLDREAYSRSTYIPQNSLEVVCNDSMQGKLGGQGLGNQENDMNAYGNAIEKLEQGRRRYKKLGGKGKIQQDQLRAAGLVKQLREAQEKEVQCEDYKSQLKEKGKEGERLREQCRDLNRKIQFNSRLEGETTWNRKWEYLEEQLNEVENELRPYDEFFSRGIPQEEALLSIRRIQEKNESVKFQCLQQLLFLLLGSLLYLMIPKSAWFGILTVIVCEAFYFGARARSSRKIMVFLSGFYSDGIKKGVEQGQKLREVEKKVEEYRQLSREADQYKEELHKQKAELKQIEARREEAARIQLALQKEELILEEEVQNNLREQEQMNHQCELLKRECLGIVEWEETLSTLEDEIAESKEQLRIIEKTKELLEQAKNNYNGRYLSRIQKSFEQYLDDLGAWKLGKFKIDAGLNVSFEEGGTYRELNYYSSGYRDLIGLSTRFALVDALFEEEKPFLILDDPFVNFDKNRIKNARELMLRMGERYQIIYFTCHESRENIPQ
ncbi:MAG: hypothetical protein RSD55_04840 [Lachnospiraceae bacterium]